MERKLVHVERVLKVRPIENADAIELVEILGWDVIVKKGEFNVGDLVLYYEIDSFLNANDERYASFSTRFSNWGTKRGMRLKTIKMRGVLSQGLVLNLKNFPELDSIYEGKDVTDILKIEKWEPLANANSSLVPSGKSVLKFPVFLKKTDQERIQNYSSLIHKSVGFDTFEVSLKEDGSSMTVFHLNLESKYLNTALQLQISILPWFRRLLTRIKYLVNKPKSAWGVCSRNLLLTNDDNSHFSAFVRDNNLIEKLAGANRNVAIQGELIGPAIQSNYEKVEQLQYHVFNVFDIDKQEYLSPTDARAFCYDIGIPYVTLLDKEFKLESLLTNPANVDNKELVQAILTMAEGPNFNGKTKREGLVFKSNQRDFSFKAISNSYLLAVEKKMEKESA